MNSEHAEERNDWTDKDLPKSIKYEICFQSPSRKDHLTIGDPYDLIFRSRKLEPAGFFKRSIVVVVERQSYWSDWRWIAAK